MRSFNSRPHAEVDRKNLTSRTKKLSFNSRPHAEVDIDGYWYELRENTFNSRPHAEVDLSPSWSSATYPFFQLTTSRRGRLPPYDTRSFLTSFNSRPHAEVDTQPPKFFPILSLSTHDLTQRSTSYFFALLLTFLSFQLTTSRRGRPIWNVMEMC